MFAEWDTIGQIVKKKMYRACVHFLPILTIFVVKHCVYLWLIQAIHNSLVGRKKDALKKITTAIDTDPAAAEYHILRYSYNN